MLSPQPAGIPYALKTLQIWEVWYSPQHQLRKGKAITMGGILDASASLKLMDFDDAFGRYQEHQDAWGIGIGLRDGVGYVAARVGNCRNPETGTLSGMAQRLIETVDTYWEVTPSGTGIQCLMYASEEEQALTISGNYLEVRSLGMFIPITGHSVTSNEIARIRSEYTAAFRAYAQRAGTKPENETLRQLKAHNLYIRTLPGDSHLIKCPWMNEHIDHASHGTLYHGATAARPSDEFSCHHPSCRGRTITQLRAFLGIGDSAKFPFMFPSDFVLETAAYTIQKWLPSGGISVLYAPKAHMKSFIAVDMLLSVASGHPWHGHPVTQSACVYIAGEGNMGLQRRFAAWAQHYGVSLADLPVALSKWPMAMLHEEQLHEWRIHVDTVAARFRQPIGLIVIDTLSANFGQGDENSNSDMAYALSSTLAILAPSPSCSILIVHHPGKNPTLGPRGAYALEANAQAVIKVHRDTETDTVRLEQTALKDGQSPPALTLSWHTVQLLPYVSSLVMSMPLSEREAAVLELTRQDATQQAIASSTGISQSTVSRIQGKLRDAGLLATP